VDEAVGRNCLSSEKWELRSSLCLFVHRVRMSHIANSSCPVWFERALSQGKPRCGNVETCLPSPASQRPQHLLSTGMRLSQEKSSSSYQLHCKTLKKGWAGFEKGFGPKGINLSSLHNMGTEKYAWETPSNPNHLQNLPALLLPCPNSHQPPCLPEPTSPLLV